MELDTIAPIQTPEPTPNFLDLKHRALLIKLRISKWPGKVRDPKAAQTLADTHGSDPEMTRVYKRLFTSQDNSFKVLSQAMTQAYKRHCALTAPWGDNGQRILLASTYLDYQQTMLQIREDMERKRATFLADYADLRAAARMGLGSLFDEADYPPTEDLAQMFAISWEETPVPDAGDFRLDALSNDANNALQARLRHQVEADIHGAMTDVWERLYQAVNHMAVTLAEPEKVFRDTLVGNLRTMIDILPHLNLTHDPNLDAALDTARRNLVKASPQTLRDNTEERERVAREAADLIKKMRGYMPAPVR